MDELRIGIVYENPDKNLEEKKYKEDKSQVIILDISPKQDNEYKI